MANEGGTSLNAMDYAEPYSVYVEGSSFPTLPDQFFPVRGIRMPHGVKTRAYFVSRVPNAVALATGLTIELTYCMPMNAKNADLTGTKVQMEVIGTPLTSGTSLLDDSALASSTADAAQSAALPTAVGKMVVQSITSTTAHLNSLAAGNTLLLRVSRLGDHANDTNLGDIILVNVDYRNT